MNRLFCCLLGLLFFIPLQAQQREKYEFRRNLPVYADSLLKDLTYPMAWGNSPVTDFNEWKKAARQKVFDCMLEPPPPPTHHPSPVTTLATEQRDGYRALKIEIPLSRYYTVPTYLLIPDGEDPFPAINALHDHGAHLLKPLRGAVRGRLLRTTRLRGLLRRRSYVGRAWSAGGAATRQVRFPGQAPKASIATI